MITQLYLNTTIWNSFIKTVTFYSGGKVPQANFRSRCSVAVVRGLLPDAQTIVADARNDVALAVADADLKKRTQKLFKKLA